MTFLEFLFFLNDFFWIFSFIIIFFIGFFLTLKSNFIQFSFIKNIIIKIFNFFFLKNTVFSFSNKDNLLSVFFISLCTSVGVGNLVTISLAIKIGGPGSVFWMWVISFFGMILKYSEIYLSLKYFKNNSLYIGIFSLFSKLNLKYFLYFSAFFFCIYSSDIYIFNIVKNNLAYCFNINHTIIVLFLIFFLFFIVLGGVKRIGNLNIIITFLFFCFFFVIFIYILILNFDKIPSIFCDIFFYAFNKHSLIGGFLGSSLSNTIIKGVSSICYSSDIGIGCSSLIYKELSNERTIEYKSCLGMLVSFIDGFIVSSMVSLMILLTEVWKENSSDLLLTLAIKKYFLYSDYIISIFLFMLGLTTLVSYIYIGIKVSRIINFRYGKFLFCFYSCFVFYLFSYIDIYILLNFINLLGALLILFNLPIVFFFCRFIKFKISF